jgi:hypothetical protein
MALADVGQSKIANGSNSLWKSTDSQLSQALAIVPGSGRVCQKGVRGHRKVGCWARPIGVATRVARVLERLPER